MKSIFFNNINVNENFLKIKINEIYDNEAGRLYSFDFSELEFESVDINSDSIGDIIEICDGWDDNLEMCDDSWQIVSEKNGEYTSFEFRKSTRICLAIALPHPLFETVKMTL